MKKQIETYLSRYSYKKSFLDQLPVSHDLGIIVTIPSYNEPNLLDSLKAISSCILPKSSVEVIVVINQPEDASREIDRNNTDSYLKAISWNKEQQNDQLRFHIIYVKDLPSKDAGVGLARKIAMDEAVRRFIKNNNESGIIVGFDADCTCDPNYLIEIDEKFASNPELDGVSIYFEHPVSSEKEDSRTLGITSYELHLRYFIHALRFARFPYAFHCVGSSMAVRASAYAKQGGMNKRKAGEDFHFLQKIIQLGNFDEIITTRVIPSARISNRVPFGTGKAMMEWSDSGKDIFLTYNPKSFEDLRLLFSIIGKLYTTTDIALKDVYRSLPDSIKEFIPGKEWVKVISGFQNQSNSISVFTDKFFNWMNGLKTLQFIHFARDQYYSNVSLDVAWAWLSSQINGLPSGFESIRDALYQIREHDRTHPYHYTKNTY